jgi:hypothetical protein
VYALFRQVDAQAKAGTQFRLERSVCRTRVISLEDQRKPAGFHRLRIFLRGGEWRKFEFGFVRAAKPGQAYFPIVPRGRLNSSQLNQINFVFLPNAGEPGIPRKRGQRQRVF